MGPLSLTSAERNVLTGGLVERDHKNIWRDVGSRDHAVVQCLQQSQSFLLGTVGDKRDLQQNQVVRIMEPQERPRVKEMPRGQDVNDLEEIVRWNPQCAHQTMLNRVRYLAETSLGIASFEDMDLGDGHVESPLLIVTLSRSTCAISGFSCLLGRPSKPVGFTRRTNMTRMNMYLHIMLMALCRRHIEVHPRSLPSASAGTVAPGAPAT